MGVPSPCRFTYNHRNISNRFLEALFYGKAAIITEIVRFIHPELKHERHIYVSTWDTIVEDSLSIVFEKRRNVEDA